MISNPIYRKIVAGLLNRMKKGKLTITENGRSNLVFGNGNEVEADIHVNDPQFFKRIVLYADVGFGESYMLNEWETSNLTGVISFMIGNIEYIPTMSDTRKVFNPINLLKISNRLQHVFKPNSLKGSLKNISKHYDLSNDFFSRFLDPTMTYSSALFLDKDDSLEKAQIQKYDSLCRATKLTQNDHLLEIGCGWGGFAMHAARKYGCKVTGITISREQFHLAKERIKKAGLEKQIEILFEDYRKIRGKFDKIISIEMIEAVGHKYFNAYFRKINQLLKSDGVLGLQAIIVPDSRYNQYRKDIGWIQKHIFPGGLLPSIAKINESINSVGNLNLYNLKEMGLSYAQTLKNWFNNFHNNLNFIQELGFDEPFVRKWEFYLCSCEASFLLRNINVVQMVYARPNNPNF